MDAREVRRHITLEDMQSTDRWCAGSPEEVRDSLIRQAEAVGANTIMLNFNQGAMPHEMNMRVIRRFAEEVLPDLHAHQITSVPAAQ